MTGVHLRFVGKKLVITKCVLIKHHFTTTAQLKQKVEVRYGKASKDTMLFIQKQSDHV